MEEAKQYRDRLEHSFQQFILSSMVVTVGRGRSGFFDMLTFLMHFSLMLAFFYALFIHKVYTGDGASLLTFTHFIFLKRSKTMKAQQIPQCVIIQYNTIQCSFARTMNAID